MKHISPSRVLVSGAIVVAFLYFVLSLSYETWALGSTLSAQNKTVTPSFGLWKKCELTEFQAADKNVKAKPNTFVCHHFADDNKFLSIEGTPGFIHATRAMTITSTILVGISMLTSLTLTLVATHKPMFCWIFPSLAINFLLGAINIGVFQGSVENLHEYDRYVMGWTFYYYVIGWIFVIGAFLATLKERGSNEK